MTTKTLTRTIPNLNLNRVRDSERRFKLVIFYYTSISSNTALTGRFIEKSKLRSIEYYINNIDDMSDYSTYDNIVKYIQNTFPLLVIAYIDVYELIKPKTRKHKRVAEFLMRIKLE